MIFDIFLEFVECAVHQILYIRQVYPECINLYLMSAPYYVLTDIFEKRVKYGVSVWQSCHNEVNNYIERVLDNSKLLLEHVYIYKVTMLVTGDRVRWVDMPLHKMIPVGM